MARADLGGSGLGIPASDRIAEPSFYDQRQENRERRNRQQGQEQGRRQQTSEGGDEDANHRAQTLSNPQRSTLFDLLFEEVDATPEIDEPVKRRLKQNVRRSLRRQETRSAPQLGAPAALPRPAEPAYPQHGHADDLVHVVVPASDTIDPERLVRIAAEAADDAEADHDRVVEARMIASQLRHCLSQHTDTSRKVSTYLRALLVVTQGGYKPKLVIEV